MRDDSNLPMDQIVYLRASGEKTPRTDRLLSVRLTPEVYELLQAEADSVGISVSEAIRQLIGLLLRDRGRGGVSHE